MAHHQADRRLPLYGRLDRYRLVPIRHDPPRTYHVAGELVRRGADLAKICDEVYQSYPVSRGAASAACL